jgi:biotin carboxyl carrier protein
MKLEIKIHAGSKTSEHRFELSAPVSTQPGETRADPSLTDPEPNHETINAEAEEISPGVYSILINGHSYEVQVSKRAGDPEGYTSPYVVNVGLNHYLVGIHDPRRRRYDVARLHDEGPQDIAAPMPGKIVKLLVSENQEVVRDQGLLVIEAMKMQNEIRAPRRGRVERVYAQEGSGVEAGFRLLRLV